MTNVTLTLMLGNDDQLKVGKKSSYQAEDQYSRSWHNEKLAEIENLTDAKGQRLTNNCRYKLSLIKAISKTQLIVYPNGVKIIN